MYPPPHKLREVNPGMTFHEVAKTLGERWREMAPAEKRCVCVCVCVCVHTYTYTYTFVHIYIQTHLCTCIYIHIYIHTHIYTYTYTFAHIYIHTHIYTNTFVYIYREWELCAMRAKDEYLRAHKRWLQVLFVENVFFSCSIQNVFSPCSLNPKP